MLKDIAIIGVGGRFPNANTVEDFYENLKNGKDSIRRIDRRRIINTTIEPETEYQDMAYIDNIDCFDYDFFNIVPGEAKNIDPHQRILLEIVYQTFENAGYNPEHFSNTNTSVYVASKNLSYHKHTDEIDPTLIIGNLNSATAGRVARFFNLRGSASIVDSACSSSLLALYQAYNELLLGLADQALVCAIDLTLFPLDKSTEGIGIFSKDGKSKSFSATANGAGLGEAVGCILLKPLEAALLDKDIIHCVIKGIAVNQDANLSATLTSPDSQAQAQVLTKAWERANIDPRTITYIEAHGTGTILGDPIEVTAIDLAFSAFTNDKQFCALSSVKTNIGHSDSAAGMVGLIKTVLSLKRKVLFPSLHFTEPNPYINFERSSVYVNTRFGPWHLDLARTPVRRAGVSSFGVIGTNCHVVLEEAPPASRSEKNVENTKYYLITVSAKCRESLELIIKELKKTISERSDLHLDDVSYTLNCGRKHFDSRFCVVVNSTRELMKSFDRLENFSRDEDKPVKLIFVCSGKVQIPQSLVDHFCSTYLPFRETLQSLQQSPAWIAENDSVLLFAFQYCFYKLLEQRGLTTQFFIGDGIGKITIAVLKGNLSLADGIKKAADFIETNEDELQQRLHTLLTREAQADHRCLFIEMGPKGSVSSGLDKLKVVYPYYNVAVLQEHEGSDALLELFRTVYLHHGSVNWTKLMSDSEGSRIELPGYKFRKTPCWIKEQTADVTQFLFDLNWQEQSLEVPAKISVPGSVYIVFMSEMPLADLIVNKLEDLSHNCIKVYSGDSLRSLGPDSYQINWSEESDYLDLKNELSAKGFKIAGLIHLGGLAPSTPLSPLEKALSQSLFSQLYMTKAFDELLRTVDCSFLLVTSNGRVVTGTESELFPAFATVHGYINSLHLEYPRIKAACLDVDVADFDNPSAIASLLQNLAAELDRDKGTICAAYRQGRRYVPKLDKVRLRQEDRKALRLIEGGVYLITGGASGIGLEVANYLAEMERIKLVIVSRKQLPDRAAFKHLEELGTVVRYFSVNVANEELTTQLLEEVKRELGPIRGIVHSAGLPGTRRVNRHNLDTFKEALEPKVYGMHNLHKAMRGNPLDFFVVFSSNDSIIGTDRGTNYSAANLFEECYVQQLRRQGVNAMAISWPLWRETGWGKRFHEGMDMSMEKATTLSTFEGISALESIMQYDRVGTFVSKEDFNNRGENPYYFVPTDFYPVAKTSRNQDKTTEVDGVAYSPRTDWTTTENRIAHTWYNVLKKESLELDTNFFKIGGHSLLGARIINRLERELEVDLEFADLVQRPTIKQLATYIDARLNEGITSTFKSIEAIPTAVYYSVSHAQRRLWVLSQLEESSLAYNEFDAFIIKGELDAQLFEKAFQALVARHEILRTTFAFIAGELKQQVHEFTDNMFDFQQMDWGNVADKRVAIDALAYNEANAPFRLDKGPLLRSKLIQLERDEYIFLFTMHHIICDEWSKNVIIREIMTRYGDYKHQKPSALTQLKIHYKDYAHWYRQFQETEEFKQHQAYWLAQMAGTIPAIQLPLDRPRPKLRKYKGALAYFSISGDKLEVLKRLGRQQESTLFMNLLSLVFSILHRYTGQNDIIIGSSRAGRNHIDLEEQIGLYLHTLAIRVQFINEDNFETLIKKVKQATLDAYKHELYPFDQLVEDLNMKRDMSRSALFDVMVDLHNTRNYYEESMQLSGVQTSHFDTPHVVSKFDLTFHFEENENGVIAGKVEYNTEIFDSDRIERMVEHLLGMLEAARDTSSLPISRLDFLTSSEKAVLDSFCSSTSPSVLDEETVIAMFEAQALLYPNNTALRYGEKTLTYKALNEKSNQLARFLQSAYGIGTRHLVAIFVERSDWSVVAILAVLKTGAAYVPIDTEHPRERVNHILEDAAINVLLTQSEYLHKFNDFKGSLCALDIEVDVLNTSSTNLDNTLAGGTLAYVIYTSGSSGKPKGCLIEHRNLSSYVSWANQYYFGGTDTGNFALFTSLAFDLTITSIFCTLTRGKCLTVFEQKAGVADVLTAIFNAQDIDAVKLTPTHLNLLEKLNLSATNIKKVIVGGEQLTSRQVRALMSIDDCIELYNEYGPTETTVGCTVKKIDDKHAPVTIGRPITGASILIVDPQGMLCPIGIEGEIYIGGSGVARDYLNLAGSESKKFVPNTFTGDGRLYRSGDQGRWRADGEIEYLGRKDDQVKIRGFRVELSEVEEIVLTHPGVAEAVVIRHYDEVQVAYLTAYVVMRDSSRVEDIRKFVKSIAPDYMIPSFFVQLKQLPVTVNGKVDRQSLPDPVFANQGPIYNAPQHKVEKEMCAIWERLFKRERIGTSDNFFDLGGNSLKMVDLLFAVDKMYPNTVKISDLYDYPTIKEISAIVNEKLVLHQAQPAMQDQSEEFETFEL